MSEGIERGAEKEAQRGAAWPVSRGMMLTLLTLLALLAGFLLRLYFILRFAHLEGDVLVYGDIARNLLEHHVYGFTSTLNGLPAPPRPTLIRLPGYPLFLALCFRIFGVGRYGAVLLVQAAIDLCSCLLMAGTARRIFGRRAGMAALWLAALCPFTANYVAAPLTETLTLFCIALVFYAMTRWGEEASGGWRERRWLLAVAFALGYAILLRPEQGLLAAAVAPAMPWMRWKRASGRGTVGAVTPILLMALLALLPLVPWAARNWHTFHQFQPLAPRFANDPGELNPSGFQRWYRTWGLDFVSTETAYWSYDDTAILLRDLPDRAFDSPAQHEATAALLADYNVDTTATPALDQRFNAIALERIRAKPLRYYVFLPVGRLMNMILRPRTEMLPVAPEWWRFREHWRGSVFAAAYALLNLLYLVLAGLGLARPGSWRQHQPLVWAMVASLALRAALLLTIDNSEPRYTLEFFPLLVVLGSRTAVSLWDWVMRTRTGDGWVA